MKKIFLFLFFFASLQANFEYELSICAIIKDEGPWLREWLEYHRLTGVEHFFLYDNESTDNTPEVLAPYVQKGIVTLIPWPDGREYGEKYAWVRHTQMTAYLNALKMLKGRSRWVAFIDVDEFIVPITTSNLVKFLKDYDECGALVVNWSCYGPSHYWDIPPNKLMIECLTRKMPDNHVHNLVVKSIIQPNFVLTTKSPHEFVLVPTLCSVDANKVPYKMWETLTHSKIKINHYFTRTLNYLYNEKIPRKARMDNAPLQTKEDVQWMINDGNAEKDKAKDIFKYIPQLRKIIFAK